MAKESIEKALAQVDNDRRGFLKGLLLGSAALAALPLITSTAVAQDTTTDTTTKKKKKKGTDTTGNAK
jgi:orotate phosphoribosyltransferase